MARTPGTKPQKTAQRTRASGTPQQTEGLFRALVENSLDAIVVLGPDGTIRYESRSIQDLMGYRPEDRVGGSGFEHIHPDDVPDATAALAEAVGNPGTAVLTELRVHHADGSWHTLQVVARNLQDNPAVGGVVVSFRDITELRSREEELRESESRWRTIAEATAERVMTVDRDGTILFVNRVAPGRTVEDVVGTSLYDYAGPGQEKLVRKALRSVFRSASTVKYDVSTVIPGGETLWYETNAAPIVRDGEVVAAAILALDVTERKQAERALKESEENWRTLVEAAPERIFTVDRDGTILFVNRVAPGRTVEEVIGTCMYDWLSPEGQKTARKGVESVLRSGEIAKYSVLTVSPNGEHVWYDSTVAPIVRGGNIVGAIIVSTDVTERKRTEEELQRKEQYFRALIENSQDAVAVLDREGDHRYASPSYERVLGRKPQDEIGKRGLDYVYEEDLPRASEAFARLLTAPGSTMREDVRVWREDGSLRTIEVIAGNLLDDPVVQGIVSNFRDITPRKEAEAALEDYQHHLEELVAERTSDLERANAELKLRIEEQGQAEQALRESERRFRDLANLLPQIVFEMDEQGDFIFANRAVFDAAGYDQTDVDRGLSAFDTLVPEDRDRATDNMKKVMSGERSGGNEYLMIRKDGTTFPILVYTSPIAKEGKPVGLRGIAIDLTERKKMEEQLRESREELNSVISSMDDLVFTLDENGVFLDYQQPQSTHALYVPPEEFKGKSFKEVLPSTVAEPIQSALDEVAATGEAQQLDYCLEIGDQLKWFNAKISPRRSSSGVVCAFTAVVRDITGRKQAEEALEASEQRFRTLIEKASDVIVIVGDDGKIKYESPAVEEVLGYVPEELVGRDAMFGLHPDSLPHVTRDFEFLLEDPSITVQTEIVYQHKDGSWRDIEATGRNLIKDPAVTGLVINFRDITERKQMVEQLRGEQEYFRSLIERAHDVTMVLDGSANILFASPSLERTFGFEPQEVVGKSAFDFLHPDDLPNAGEAFVNIRQTGGTTSPVEIRTRHKDGSWRFVEAVGQDLVNDPAVQGFVVNFRDVTDLREADRRLRALIEHSESVIGVLDRSGTVRYHGPSLENVLGYKPDERVGGTHLDLAHPDDRERLANMMAELMRSPGATFRTEARYKHKDGSWRLIEGSATNLLDDPAVQGIVINSRDATERKQAEAVTQELYEQEKELRQRLEAEIKRRMEFTRALAHELKTPLTSVLASSDLLESEITDETLLGLARNIKQGASNLDDRIDELLDLARGEVGMLQLKTETVDLLPLLREAADRVTSRTVERGLSLVQALPPRLPAVEADAARVEQVVTNLLDNAIKFTPHGGRITLRARETEDAVTIEVQDTGGGIPKEARERLFEPYQRLDSDRENLSGLGLGLSLSKALVELHGGRIWVKSRVGRGSTFGFSLPLRPAPRQTQEPEQPGKLWKVLIIEDDHEIVNFVALNFRLRWPEAELISTGLGEEGVEMVESEDPHVVILDLGLPDISGFEVLRQIRLFSSVPVVVLTVRGDEADMVKGLEWGADDYLVKPFRPSELLARLKVQARRKLAPAEGAPIACGSLRLDPSTFQMTHGDKEISLTIVEGRIIEHLMRNAGQVVTHSRLAEAVWGEDYPGAIESLRVYIRYLRQKLEKDPSRPKLILTKAGVGYSLAKPT